jgi:hypothetical protein
VQAAYFRVGGRTFDRQDPLGRLTFQGAQHLQTLGALTDYDRYKEDAEKNWPWEGWQGDYSWRNAHLMRRDATRYRWFLDQLVVIRDEERTRLGWVTRVAVTPPNELAMSLAIWRRPAHVAHRAAAHVQRGAHPALHGYGPRAQVSPDQAPPARRRLRARGVRRVVARPHRLPRLE